MQIPNVKTVLFRIDRSLSVKSKGFVTAGGQRQKSQKTQRHSEENFEKKNPSNDLYQKEIKVAKETLHDGDIRTIKIGNCVNCFPRVTPVIIRISHDRIMTSFVQVVNVGVNDFLTNKSTDSSAEITRTA